MMKIFAWLTIVMGIASIFVICSIPYTFLFAPAVVGWILCLSWVALWATAFDKVTALQGLLHKSRDQNNEFANDLISTLKKQKEEIERLRNEKTFLMLTLEEYLKGKIHDRKN